MNYAGLYHRHDVLLINAKIQILFEIALPDDYILRCSLEFSLTAQLIILTISFMLSAVICPAAASFPAPIEA
jgi:hypothetical protein